MSKVDKDGFKKIEDKIFKFEKVGDELIGEFLSKETGLNFGNDVYKIKDKDDIINVVFSTTVLASKMSTVNEGNTVKIVFAGEKENTNKGQHNIKLFDVFVKE